MNKFELNEVVTIVDLSPLYSKYNGEEAEVIELIGLTEYSEAGQQFTYRLKTSFGDRSYMCPEICMRKKKPPKEEASWKRIQEITNWNPIKEKAELT